MQTSPNPAPVASTPETTTDSRARRVDDVAYQLMTVGAILLLLGSLWVF